MKLETQIYRNYAIALIGSLLIFRIIALIISPLGLHGDEAQYWAWSRNPDFGYFSKPPMVAWVIALTTSIFGNAEWAVRLGSPIIHSLTAGILFLTGQKLHSPRAGFWAAVIYILMPAVWLSSGIISTDVSLLFFWALGLHAWVSLRDTPNWGRILQLGIALGLGFMSKYAMMFFGPALILAILFDAPTRKALLHGRGLAVLLIAAALIMPNILWNMQNDFVTVAHTADNANLQRDIFNPEELLGFWRDQLAVFGPVTLVLLILALISAVRRKLPPPVFWLALLSLTPLFVISAQAFMSRANANWAVTAYVAAPLILAIWALGSNKKLSWLKWGVIGQSLLSLTLGLITLSPSLTNDLGLANSVKRLRAWPETVQLIQAQFEQGHDGQAFKSIAVDDRLLFFSSEYYDLRDVSEFYMWRLQDRIRAQAEITHPLTAQDGPILIINRHFNYEPFLKEDFARLERLPDIDLDLGGGKRRQLRLWAGYGYTPTTDPNRSPQNN